MSGFVSVFAERASDIEGDLSGAGLYLCAA